VALSPLRKFHLLDSSKTMSLRLPMPSAARHLTRSVGNDLVNNITIPEATIESAVRDGVVVTL
jgi:hypothetical protein